MEYSRMIDNKTMVHAGLELVVIGGVVVYFRKRNNELQEEINLLKEENRKLTAAVTNIEMLLSNMINNPSRAVKIQTQPTPAPPVAARVPETVTEEKPPQSPVNEEEALDKELEEELSELNQD